MLYLIKDNHGFTLHILKVKSSQISSFGMADAVRNFIRVYNLESSIDFDVELFIIFLARNGIKAKLCKFDVTNLKV